MQRSVLLVTALLSIGAASAFAIACSSSSSNGSSSDAGSDAAKACTTAANEQACASTGSACLRCCSCFHQSGVQTFNNALSACVCAPSACQSVCASSLCATPSKSASPGDACSACVSEAIGADGGCNGAINAACVANPDCAALLACTNGPAGDGDGGCP